jgi:hypothetical protein
MEKDEVNFITAVRRSSRSMMGRVHEGDVVEDLEGGSALGCWNWLVELAAIS